MSDVVWDVVTYGCWAIFAVCFIASVAGAVRFWSEFQAFKRGGGQVSDYIDMENDDTAWAVTLPAFLLARITEDERAAEMNGPTVSAIPDRAMAECDAKRRIIHDWDTPIPDFDGVVHLTDDAQHLFRLLALPYADHPDYRPEWRP